MSEQPETADMDCPAAATCSLHANAQLWAREGNLEAIEANMTVMWVLRNGAWRRCTCRLFERMLRMLGKEHPGSPRG